MVTARTIVTMRANSAHSYPSICTQSPINLQLISPLAFHIRRALGTEPDMPPPPTTSHHLPPPLTTSPPPRHTSHHLATPPTTSPHLPPPRQTSHHLPPPPSTAYCLSPHNRLGCSWGHTITVFGRTPCRSSSHMIAHVVLKLTKPAAGRVGRVRRARGRG